MFFIQTTLSKGMIIMALPVFLGCADMEYSPFKPCFTCAHLGCVEKDGGFVRNSFIDQVPFTDE